MKTRTTLIVCALAVLALVAVQPARALTIYWDEEGLNKSWNTATNWSDDTLPNSANEYVLDLVGMTASYGLDNSFTIQTLTLNAASMTDLDANTSGTDARVLTLNGGTANPLIKVGTSASAAVNIGAAGGVGTLGITVAASGDIDVASAKTLTIKSVIGQSGTRSLTKTGDGALILTGAGSGISGTMTVSGGSMTISNGGTLWNEYGTIGNAGQNNITVTVTGAGSNWSTGDALKVGAGGTGNTLKIENGATVWSYFGFISRDSDSNANNTVTVTDPGSAWNVYWQFEIHDRGAGNKLEIKNGGKVNANQGGDMTYIAWFAGADNNTVLVDGSGSEFNTRNVNFSNAGKNNTITISNGGKMTSWDLDCKNTTGNVVNVWSGGQIVANTLRLQGADTVLNLGDGTSISTVSVNRFKLETAGSRLNINNGRLTARENTIELVYSLGQVNLIGPAYIDTAGYNGTINRVIYGDGSLTKEGLGTLTLTNANTYTGNTAVNQGFLQLSPSGAITMLVQTISRSFGAAANFNPGASGVIQTTTGNSNGIIGGWATYGTDDWAVGSTDGTTLTNVAAATYTDTSTALDDPANYTDNNMNVNSSQTPTDAITPNSLRFNSAGAYTLTLQSANTITSGGILVGTTVGDNLSKITGGTLTNGTELIVTQNNAGNSLEIGSAITGGGAVTKWGPGPATLSGTNDYTGATTVSAGTLKAGSTAAFGTNSAVTLISGAALDITGFNNSIGSLNGGNGAAGNVTLGAATLTVGGDGTSPVAYAGVISGAGGGLTKIGGGTQILSGANLYTGTTTVNAGTLRAGNATAFGPAANASLAFGPGSTGKVQLYGNSMTVIGLNTDATVGTPIVESGSGAAGTDTLTVNNATENTFAGVLQNGGARNLALTKTGTGLLTLSGPNTYTGTTTVSAGTLTVTNGTVTRLNVPGGTANLNTLALNANATGGQLNLNANVTNTLTVAGGTVTVGAGATVGTADFQKAGAGTVNATNPLTVTNMANVNGTKITLGGGGTSFTLTGADVIHPTALSPRTITASSGTVTISIPQYPTSGLMGRWTFDDDSANDSSENGYNGTIVGTPTFTTNTHAGQGKALNVAEKGYVKVDDGGSQTVFDGGSAMTISAWVNGWPKHKQDQSFVSKQGAPNGWRIGRVNNWGTQGFVTNGSNLYQNSEFGGGWLLYTMTYDGTTKKIYYNGVLDGSVAWTGPINHTNAWLVFGGYDDGNHNVGNSYIGMLDDIYFYNRAISPSEVADIYNFLPPEDLSTTDLAASSTSEVSLPAGVTTLGNLSLSGASTQLTLSGATATGASFDNISATDTSSIAAGLPISLRTGDVTVAGEKTLTVDTTIVDGTSATVLNKLGSGTLLLTCANTYTGATTVNAGTLRAGNATAFGPADTASLVFGPGSTGKVQLNGNSMTVIGLNTDATVGTPIVESGSGTAGTDTLTVNNATANTFAGVLQNGGTRNLAMTKIGAGTLTLSGANTYTGATTVSDGILKAGIASVPNTSGAFGNNSAVTLADTTGVVLDIAGCNTQIGSLTGGGGAGGNVTLGAATLTVGGDGTSPPAYAGVIAGEGGGLTKTGGGTLTLSGDNLYTGATTVSNGTLLVNGSLVYDSTVTVAGGATLGGTGTIGGATIINGHHTPGTSAGIQTFGNNLTYNATSDVTWELVANTDTQGSPGSEVFDQIMVDFNLDFAGTTALVLKFNTPGSAAVDWTNAFWDDNQSWLVYDAGTTSNLDNLVLTVENWADSNGLPFDAAQPDKYFYRSLAGGDVMLNYLVAGDANLDRTTNARDYVVVSNHYNVGSQWTDGDVDGDGVVNARDYVVISNNYGSHTPEPATLALLGLGGLGVLLRRKRK